jgi:orotate phosphoribosyltransferase
MNLFQEHQGWLVGHTQFRNGDHSDGWIEKGCLVRHPSRLELITQLQATQIATHFPDAQLLIGAAQCGAIIASSVARALDLDLALTAQQSDGLSFHRMHIPMRGSIAVLVEDLICSGTDVRTHIAFFEQFGIELLGVSAWINRQPNQISGYPVVSLLPAPFQTYRAADCPFCQQGIPVHYTSIRE